ncbi:hypothetical protein J6590_073258 [Homalodisca vitripennis]|nr:hypothetical protein J6590_073258 [Homalodisca vitripennis]
MALGSKRNFVLLPGRTFWLPGSVRRIFGINLCLLSLEEREAMYQFLHSRNAGWGKYPPPAAVMLPCPVSPPLLGTRPLALSPDRATTT